MTTDMADATAYFQRLDATRFQATPAVGGAWNTAEQHVAPALGLLAHVLDRDHASRRSTELSLARIGYDILGVLPIDTVEISIRVARPGRTIELIEATLSHDDRPAVVARAWYVQSTDTERIAGTYLSPLPAPGSLAPWSASEIWPGRFVTTVDIRRHEISPGRAQAWMRPQLPLLDSEPVSGTGRLLSIVAICNGLTPRLHPATYSFPNVDTTVHLFRPPQTEWLGFDTTVSFGPGGTGLTHTALHDEHGPLGTAQQTLTLRPR